MAKSNGRRKKPAPKLTPEKPAKLTARQQRFVEEYLIDLNATAAYKRAGYASTGKAAGDNAARLIAKDSIQAAIRAALELRSRTTGLTADRIWDEWRCIALSDLGDIIDFSGADPKLRPANEISEDARRAIASVKVKRYTEGVGEAAREIEIMEFKLWDKPSVLRDAARAKELFKERLEITGANGGDVRIRFVEFASSERAAEPAAPA